VQQTVASGAVTSVSRLAAQLVSKQVSTEPTANEIARYEVGPGVVE